jgi:hypothetical protein
MSRLISAEEISKHIFKGDLWVVIGDCVYDLTEFAPTHPGGFGSEFTQFPDFRCHWIARWEISFAFRF